MTRRNLRLLTVRAQLLGQVLSFFNRAIRVIATLSVLCIGCINGSGQTLTLDDFKSGDYVVSLDKAQAQDIHFAQLPPGSLLGSTRETIFGIGALPLSPSPPLQSNTLGISTGYCIVNTGFGVSSGLQIYYGSSPTGSAPLGLDLSGYSAFRLNFGPLTNDETLGVEIAVWLNSGAVYAMQAQLPISPSPFSIDFPFAKFSPIGGLTQLDVKDIAAIGIVTWAGTAVYGITSFEAIT